MTTAKASPKSVKDILKAAHILLQPPGALPTEGLELEERVKASWAFLPHSWDDGLADLARRSVPEEAGSESEVASRDRASEAASLSGEESTKTAVGARCLDLLVGLQSQLVKEFWSAEVRGGDARDFILGTADLRLLRLLSAQSLEMLSRLSRSYLSLLQSTSAPPADPALRPVLSALLSLLRPTLPPSSPGPSAPRHLPPTTITQLLSTSHLPPILLSAALLGYTPSARPPVHADIRQGFLSALGTLPPSQALLALSGALSLASPRRKISPASISEDIALPLAYPAYVAQTIQKQLSAQLLRPTGVRGLLINLLGERALSDAEPVDEKVVDHAVQILRRIPAGVEEGRYVRHVTRECLELLAPPLGQGKQAPRAFRAVAGGVIGLWLRMEVVDVVLREAFTAVNKEEEVVGEEERRWRSISLLDTLIAYTDPAHLPSLLGLAVRPLLPALETLAGSSSSASSSSPSVVSGDVDGRESEQAMRMAEEAAEILQTWRRVMETALPA